MNAPEPPSPIRKVRIRDVAEMAGVAVGSVSHYLNHPERVSVDKAARIRSAIDRLGFVPNSLGQSLRSGESDAIAYIAPDIAAPFFSRVAEGIEAQAATYGLSSFLANSHGLRDREDSYLHLFERYRVRGLVVASYSPIEDRLREVRERGTANVLLGQQAVDERQPSVSIDERQGGQLATSHLLEIGRRRIAFVGGPLSIFQIARRLQGAGDAVREFPGATLELIDQPDRTIAGGQAIGRDLIGRLESGRPDGIFAVNDLVALGILQAYIHAGLRIPEDVAIVGYDDIDYAESSIVPLTTIRAPHDALGRAAVELLVANVEAGTVRHVVMAPELVVRESTAGR
jgi:LacI family transcriptional regulator